MVMLTPEAIKDLRLALGKTVDEMAEKIGVSWRTVYHWECGHSHPKYSTAIKLEELAKKAGVQIPA